MRRFRRKRVIFAAVAAAAIAVLALVIAIPGARDVATVAAIDAALHGRGLAFHARVFRIDSGKIEAADVEIDSLNGSPVFTAGEVEAWLDPAVWTGRSPRRYGLITLSLMKPVLHVIRLEDGSYNLSSLLGGPGAGPAPAPLHVWLIVRAGGLDFRDPTAPAPQGRSFLVQDIIGSGHIEQGERTALDFNGTFVAGSQRAPLALHIMEDDARRFARAELSTNAIDAAPIVDGLAPTKAFVVERGVIKNVRLRAFSIGYDPAAGPQWQSFGTAELFNGRFRVLPLTVPVVAVHGPLAFAAGHLSSPHLDGTLASSPVAVGGGLRLLGGVLLGLSIDGRQSLDQLRLVFPFSKALDVRGPVDIAVRVDGPPASLDVAATYSTSGTVDYTTLPLSDVKGTFFYHNGHLTFPIIDGEYDGGSLAAGGDIDLNATPISGDFALLATMPSDRLPVVANVNGSGTARAIGTIRGPLSAMEGTVFADIVGGDGISMRTAVDAGPSRFVVGPALVDDPNGGELIASGGIDRTTPARTISGRIVSRSISLHALAASRILPGINDRSPLALPRMDGTISGTVVIAGDEASPNIAIRAAADGLVVNSARLGHATIVASGSGGRIRIAAANVDGPDFALHAAGEAHVSPKSGRYAAALTGSGAASLATIAGGPSTRGLRGATSGDFSAALAGGRWTVSLRAVGENAGVGGVAIHSLDTTLGGGGGDPTSVYAGRLAIAGGGVSAMGQIPGLGANARRGDLEVWSDGVNLDALSPKAASVSGGRAVASARIGGTFAAPVVTGAASVVGARFNGQPLSGDVQVRYAGDTLLASGGRVTLGDNSAQLDGTVSGLSPGGSVRDARLTMVASMREGDLGALASRYLPPSVKLDGSVAATLRIQGTIDSPRASGYVDAGTGTVQGVAFHDLRGTIAASSTAVQVSGGTIGVGTSAFAFGGSLSPDTAHVRASSAHVDLSDFNDFFAGYDTLEGRGHGEIALQSTRAGIEASGAVDLTGANVLGYPLGRVDADFASSRDRLLVTLRQNGDAGSTDVHGSVAFAPHRGALPQLRTARYDLAGSVSGLDLGRIAPLVGREDLRVSGLLDATGYVRGDLRAPSGHADIALRGGHIGKVAIEAATGSIDTDGTVVSIRNAAVSFPFAHVDGAGTVGPGKRIEASAGIDASDLGTLVALSGHPGIASGTALASVHVSGTIGAPKVSTTLVSGRGAALGVRFDRMSGSVAYQPGEVEIGNAEMDLAGGRGILTIGGTLPLQLEPFGLGPKDRPVALTVAAKSVDIAALDPLVSRYASMEGMLDVSGSVTGTAGRPQLGGSAQLRNATIASPLETVPAEHLNADLTLSRDTLTLTRLRADVGSGTLAGSGAVHIVPAVGLLNVAGLQYWTRLHLRNAQADVPGWVSGSVSGDVRLTKSGTIPFLAGDVTLDDGSVPFSAIYRLASGYGAGPAPESGPLPGVPALQPGHIVVYGGSVFGGGGPYVLGEAPGAANAPPAPSLPSVDLAVSARAGRDLRVHGGAIDLTASGGVMVGGNLRSPTLAGEFSATRGQIGYFDTNFRLVRGLVTFDPVEGLLPTLDVKAVTNLSGVEITLTVTGRIDNLQTDLSSNPSMTRDEIAATLLHAPQVASVISSTPGVAQTVLASEAESYFNAQLTRSLLFPVESLLAQTINVEQISLIYDQQGKVDVEVRKLITPTVYAIYRSSLNIPVTQTAGVAYSLRDYADLEILQTQSSSGLQQSLLNLRLTFH